MTFENPIWLAAGAAACAGLVGLVVWTGKQRASSLARFAAGHLLGKLAGDVSVGRRRVKAVLLVGAVACLFTALARPQWGTRWEEVHRRGIDILLAVDTSRSMLASDVAPDRLSRAKMGIHDFVEKLEGDRVGLLPFAGEAFLLCPMTLDYGAFQESLNALDTSIIPVGGTDIAAALRAAENAFEKGTNHKILVMITDGEDLEGEALEAARAAAEKGITIHTVGVGTPNGELIPLGGGSFLKDENGEVVRSKLDEEMLGEIARVTGGIYAPLGDRAEGLDTIYQEKLSLVPKEDLAQRTTEVKIDRFEWPLGLAIVLLVIEFGLGTAKRRRAGRLRPASGVAATAAVVALIGLPAWAGASEGASDPRVNYNDGTSRYESGEWDAAAEAFQGALDTPDVGLQGQAYYNLGNTHYRQGEAQLASGETEAVMAQWENAIARYDDALALNAEDEDARFNKEFVEKKLEELKQQQQEQEQQEQEQQDQQDQQEQQQQEQQQDQPSEGGESEQEPQDESSSGEGENAEDQPEESSEGGEESQDMEEASSDGSEEQEDRAEQEEPSGGGEEPDMETEEESPGEEDACSSGGEEEKAEEEPSAEAGQEPGSESEGEDAGETEPEGGASAGPEGEEGPEEVEAPAPAESGTAEEMPQGEEGEAHGVADQQANPDMTPRVPGEMSEEEALQLLESLEDEAGEFQPLELMRRGGGMPFDDSRKRDW